ncbi:hypothetical protein Q8F55_005008 [Vanrija albida]|uniref:Uncharacterized protein n=1 Tax=Vanrija albida TaxID=181172 RepID=A0ABR3Q0F0_9TREE
MCTQTAFPHFHSTPFHHPVQHHSYSAVVATSTIPVAMVDYLTLLRSTSVVLFRAPTLRQVPGSTAYLLPPKPIAVALLKLIYGDTDCAYFLIDHVLESARSSTHGEFNPATVDHDDRALAQAVEAAAWKEIDRAKVFSRALGQLFEHHDSVSESQVHDLAASYGLELVVSGPRTAVAAAGGGGGGDVLHTHAFDTTPADATAVFA